jgi:ferrochelatase
MKWKGPFLDEETGSAAKAGKGIIIVPISFVLENSETLYELDIEYKKLALEQGALFWRRVKTPAFNKDFIDGLINKIKVNAIENKTINYE